MNTRDWYLPGNIKSLCINLGINNISAMGTCISQTKTKDQPPLCPPQTLLGGKPADP
jgi:hypothetical protein